MPGRCAFRLAVPAYQRLPRSPRSPPRPPRGPPPPPAPPARPPPPPAVPAAPATAAAAALCLGTCFIHHEVSPPEILTVQGVHRAIRVFVIGHFNEGEPARLSRKPVANQVDARGSYTYLRKPLVKLDFLHDNRKITDIELLHLLLLLPGT